MTERPLLLRSPLVRATLSGQKTETRRVISSLLGIGQVKNIQRSSTPGYHWSVRGKDARLHDLHHEDVLKCCPYGQPGDVLWVRETWQRQPDGSVVFRADGPTAGVGPWRPAIFMPRDACRLRLRLVSIDIEQVSDLTEESARAEGMHAITLEDLLVLGCSRKWIRWYLGAMEVQQKNLQSMPLKQLYTHVFSAIDDRDADPWVWVLRYEVVNEKAP